MGCKCDYLLGCVDQVQDDPRIASFAKRLLLMKDGAIVDDMPLDGDGGESARKAMEKAGLL